MEKKTVCMSVYAGWLEAVCSSVLVDNLCLFD